MESAIVAYCNGNEKSFEATIPLQFVGQRNQRLGLSNRIHVLFSYGYENLSEAYKQSLASLGFVVHNVASLYAELDKEYVGLNQFSTNTKNPHYIKNTYLQWLMLERFFAGTPVIHYDGDIVFNEDPAVIARKVIGKTFVLQGCPAFTAISNYSWFEAYRQHLQEFLADVDGYCTRAWAERNGWEVTFRTRWAGSRFSKTFLHDQDLLSHLIHTGRIVQDSVEDVQRCLSDYVVFENPLFMHLYDDNSPFKYVREDGIDYFMCTRQDAVDCVYKKKVLFWHMQSCFNFYVSKFVLRKKMYPFLPLGRVAMRLQNPKGFEGDLNKFLGAYFHHTDRLNVYKYYFQDADFSGLLNDKHWWRPGVFQ